MKSVKYIFYKMPLSFRIYVREHKGSIDIKKNIQLRRLLFNQIHEYKKIKEYQLKIKDSIGIWIKSFKKFIIAQPNEIEVALEFFKDNIKLSKPAFQKENCGVILICIVKDDLLKVKNLVCHHRKIGVEKFAFLDNGSTDGTKEWLIEQRDVELFEVKDKYTTNRREAWVNKLIAHYGINKWYLIIDSDELFVYHNMENKSINDVVNYCRCKGITRVRAMMIDMYGDDEFYLLDNDSEYIKYMKYFDTDTYQTEHRDFIDLIIGGPRRRIFNDNTWLTKYPLFYFAEGDIEGKSHFLFPYKYNKKTECLSGLLHYKFLASDIQKYRDIANKGNYFNGSLQYKKYINYIDKHKRMSFMYKNSREYRSSEDLKHISKIKKIEFI